MAVPLVSSATGVTFGDFQRRIASLASVALCDIPTCFMMCQKIALRGRRNTDAFRRCVAFFVAGAALWRLPMSFCVAGAAL